MNAIFPLAAAQQQAQALFAQFAPILIVFAIFYFLLILPMRKRQKALQATLEALKRAVEIDGENDLAVGPCARQAGRDWYFAAGTTERGAEDNAALFNPFPDDAKVRVAKSAIAGLETVQEGEQK